MKKILLFTLFVLFNLYILITAYCDKGIKEVDDQSNKEPVRFLQQENNTKAVFNDIISQNVYILW